MGSVYTYAFFAAFRLNQWILYASGCEHDGRYIDAGSNASQHIMNPSPEGLFLGRARVTGWIKKMAKEQVSAFLTPCDRIRAGRCGKGGGAWRRSGRCGAL